VTKVLMERAFRASGHDVVFRVIEGKDRTDALTPFGLAWVNDMSLADLGRLSVAKWETIVMGYDAGATRIEDNSGLTCAFCRRFYDEDKACGGCPIEAYTKEPSCWSTPYWDYRGELANPDSAPESQRGAAQEELEFVKAVVRWITESNYQEPDYEIPF